MDTITVWNNINDRLTNFVYGKVKNAELTKDIVQDVFLKVFSKADTLRDNKKMVAWIYQIARNEIINHFRKIKPTGMIKDVALEEQEEETLTTELSECLHPLIASLAPKYREALILADIEKMSQKEIAVKLNISYSGAKSRVQRGREMLKLTMEECCAITTDVYGNVLDYKVKKNNMDCSDDCTDTCN